MFFFTNLLENGNLTCAEGWMKQVPYSPGTVNLSLANTLVVSVTDILVHGAPEVFDRFLSPIGQLGQLAGVTQTDCWKTLELKGQCHEMGVDIDLE
jgi:hypothetical protein